MPQAPATHLAPLAPAELPEIEAWWPLAHPRHPHPPGAQRARLFDSPATSPDLWLAERDAAGALLAVGFGAVEWEGSKYAGLRWFGVHPRGLELGAGRLLLDELCRRLAARGVKHALINAVPPYYIRPGVDTRETALVVKLLEWGWTLERTNYNLTVDLTAWQCPAEDSIFNADAQGHRVRRARVEDRIPLSDLIRQHWTEGWRHEAQLAFAQDPIPLFVAERTGDPAALAQEPFAGLLGFAAHDVGNAAGCFGPTGVLPSAQGAGLGKRLLWACLWDVQHAGFKQGEIGWVGPIPFYHRNAAATLGPLFAVLGRNLTP